MKNDEKSIIQTKSESGAEEFERLRTDQEKRSAVAAKVAGLSRRPAGSEKAKGTNLVRVTASQRPGHSGFNRAGQFWPSDPEGRIALVSDRMLRAIQLEPMLRVELNPDGVSRDGVEELDVPEQAVVKTPEMALQRAVQTTNVVSADLARTQVLEAENARLRAELDAAKADKGKASK
jgi:hypothetical protein